MPSRNDLFPRPELCATVRRIVHLRGMRARAGFASAVVFVLAACGGKPPPPTPPLSGAPPPPDETGDETPAGTPTSPTAGTPVAAGGGAVVGTAHPLVVEAVDRNGAWIVICQARTDDDGDGEIAVHAGMHGDTWGDRMRPFVVRGAGDGEAIDSLVGYTADGHWLVALRQGKLAVLDATTGIWTEIPGADLRDDGVPLGPHRAASIARRGEHMTYFRDDETIVVRELATGVETDVKVAGARLWRVEVEPPGQWALVYAIRTDSDKDGSLTWPRVRTSLSDRDCRGPIMSYSTGGWTGDKPDELWLELATGKIAKARGPGPAPTEVEQPELGTHDGRPVLAIDRTGRKLLGPDESGRDIPSGPLRWVDP
jgi:hypothetical protein